MGIAPGVVAAKHVAPQALHNKFFGRHEHLRFRPAKAVNALLGVTHDEDTRSLPGPCVAGQPGTQRLPLQGIGVLKFVDQHMAHPRVQALLHPAAEHGVGHQRQRSALQVSHIDPTTLTFQRGVILQ